MSAESRQLPFLPLRNAPLLPGVTLPVELGRKASVEAVQAAQALEASDPDARRLVVGVQRDPLGEVPHIDELHPVAVVGRLVQVLHGLPGRLTVLVRGIERVRLEEVGEARGFHVATYRSAVETMEDPAMAHALAGALRDLVAQHDEATSSDMKSATRARVLAQIVAERNPGMVADLAVSHVDLELDERVWFLQQLDITARLKRAVESVSRATNVWVVKRDVDRQVREHLSKHEQEAILRHKMRAIQAELGDHNEQALEELAQRLAELDLPDEAREEVDRELARVARMNPQSGEANQVRTFLEWVADLPWGPDMASPETLDIDQARSILEADHYGLDKAKRRIIEYLSVRKLAPNKRGPILCFAGPPGVGKTSLTKSIATALGREFVRISLGGVRDEAEIRGHRRTYVGALPGRFIQAYKRAGTTNPLILLDEVDKLVRDTQRGDPSSALLEALDPEQNSTFRDHYLGMEYDLSRAVFICTANELGAIPPALRDRMEVIAISGYTIEEKHAIARQYLLPELKEDHGLDQRTIAFSDEALDLLTTQYTRESGVRELRRRMAAILRDLAMRIAEGNASTTIPECVEAEHVVEILGPPRYHLEDAGTEPRLGVATGLGWTPAGGRLLFVEATTTVGTGQLRLTGRLGEVMKESAQTALSLVRSRAELLGLPRDPMDGRDLHVHLPAGAVPKDGPSAGIALCTALVSQLSGQPVRHDVAMTGEVTLHGRVLPVGGIREKVLAAHRANVHTIILPKLNRKDERDIPERARRDLTIHYVERIEEVLAIALTEAQATTTA